MAAATRGWLMKGVSGIAGEKPAFHWTSPGLPTKGATAPVTLATGAVEEGTVVCIEEDSDPPRVRVSIARTGEFMEVRLERSRAQDPDAASDRKSGVDTENIGHAGGIPSLLGGLKQEWQATVQDFRTKGAVGAVKEGVLDAVDFVGTIGGSAVSATKTFTAPLLRGGETQKGTDNDCNGSAGDASLLDGIRQELREAVQDIRERGAVGAVRDATLDAVDLVGDTAKSALGGARTFAGNIIDTVRKVPSPSVPEGSSFVEATATDCVVVGAPGDFVGTPRTAAAAESSSATVVSERQDPGAVTVVVASAPNAVDAQAAEAPSTGIVDSAPVAVNARVSAAPAPVAAAPARLAVAPQAAGARAPAAVSRAPAVDAQAALAPSPVVDSAPVAVNAPVLAAPALVAAAPAPVAAAPAHLAVAPQAAGAQAPGAVTPAPAAVDTRTALAPSPAVDSAPAAVNPQASAAPAPSPAVRQAVSSSAGVVPPAPLAVAAQAAASTIAAAPPIAAATSLPQGKQDPVAAAPVAAKAAEGQRRPSIVAMRREMFEKTA
eukprot:TRINITY_DN2489_c0_g1_i1.p2 TRINITY_DN2489_c0_g1~~TRINITY_DN2489_c0_g1_i1.p2  ORF type:complete len:630 (+),score=144.20 TRINITY_DN2489_c0_g1_i1:247-1890(+)